MAAALNGCATTWAIATATDANWSTSSLERVSPSQEREQVAKIHARYEPPPPPPVAPPPDAVEVPVETEPPVVIAPTDELPPPVIVHPVPAPPSPPASSPPPPPAPVQTIPVPQGGISFRCEVLERPVTEHVHVDAWRYDGAWKPLTAFMFVAEVAFSALLIAQSQKDAPGPDRTALLGIGAAIGLDAIGTAILFFHPEEHHPYAYDRPGTWATKTQACPADLWVRVGHTESPISGEGAVAPEVAHDVLLSVADERGAFRLRVRDEAVVVKPSRDDRCAWAKAEGIPEQAAFCAPPTDAPLLRPVPKRFDPVTLPVR